MSLPGGRRDLRAGGVGPEQALDLAAELAQLLRSDDQQRVTELGGLAPLDRLSGLGPHPARSELEVLLGQRQLQRLLGGGSHRVMQADRVPAGDHRGRLPRLFPAPAPAGLLHQPVFGHLAEVERAARDALAGRPGRLRGGLRAVLAQQHHQPEPGRMGVATQRLRAGKPSRAARLLVRHDVKISLARNLYKYISGLLVRSVLPRETGKPGPRPLRFRPGRSAPGRYAQRTTAGP